MGSLAAKDPDILRMVVTAVAVDMMHHLTRQQGTTQLPLGYRPVLVVVLTRAWVRALLVAG
jgi:hypothetical protein